MSGAMVISPFMETLTTNLQKERNLAQTSTTQYLQTLFKLNGSKPFSNLAWTKKYDDVQAIIDTYAKSTQASQYMVLTSVLSLYSEKPTYKKVYAYWREKMLEAKKERDAMPANEKTESQKENWVDWTDVKKKAAQLKEDISSFPLTKKLTMAQFDKLTDYLVLSLYTEIQPRRNQDYLYMYVVKNLPAEEDTNRNYYVINTNQFVFNKYKTAKLYNKQVIDVPHDLQEVLKLYLDHHPVGVPKSKKDNTPIKLLVKSDGQDMTTVNAITRILNRVFDKKVGSSMLRHSYLSSKYADTVKNQNADSVAMGHSVATASKDYVKF